MKLKIKNYFLFILSVGLVFLIYFLFSLSFLKGFFQSNALGADLKQELFIYGGDSFKIGGLISFASTDESSIEIGGHNIKGDVAVNIYQVEMNDVLGGLVHDNENNQINKNIDFSKFKKIATFFQNVNSGFGNESKLILPLEGVGSWIVNVSLDGVEANTFIIRSENGALVKEGDEKMIFWIQNFSSKKSVPGANIKVYDLQNKISKKIEVQSGSDGIAKTPIHSEYDVAVIEKSGDKALIPLNLKYINTGYSYKSFVEKNINSKVFTFTDRPLYSPGDKIYFKSIIREDDDVRYSISKESVIAEIFKGWGEEREIIGKQEFNISSDGTISGEFKLSENAKTGSYNLGIIEKGKELSRDRYGAYISQISFSVEHYQKPEYGINLSVEKNELISGDELSFSVDGSYFSGQPLSGKDVSYVVYSSDFYEYSYYRETYDYSLSDDYRYGYRYGSKIKEGKAILDEKGRAKIELQAIIADSEKRKSQIFSIEVELEDESGNQTFERKNILVRSGEFDIYREEDYYNAKINEETSLKIITSPRIASKEIKAEIVRTWWEKYQEDNKKYPSYKQKKETLDTVYAVTDNEGKTDIKFTPRSEGSYKIKTEGIDSRGNRVAKEFFVWVSDSSGYYSGGGENNKITVNTSKEEYDPSEKIQLNIYSEIPDSDVFLSMERERVDRYQVVHLNGNNASIELPIAITDIPNIFAYVGSFSESKLESSQKDIKISAESKKINISIIPNQDKYAPGDTANFDIKTTDYIGNPISTELAVWSVDKALFELMNSSTKDIFKTFWSERYNETENSNSLAGISIDMAEKGGGGDEPREIFKDTAYWNPDVYTDKNGYAKISFKVPDNLTTWVLSVVGATKDTKVGQITNEIMVTKNVIIRPILPNILRNDSEVVLAALVQNFTDKNQSFTASLEFDSGEVENSIQKILINSNDSRQVFWKIHPKEEKENANLKFSLSGANEDNSDIVIKTIPLRKFGFWETKAEANNKDSSYLINLSENTDFKKNEIDFSLSSTMLGSLPFSMKYLIGYPYGCVEQTTSRFVPAIIAKENSALFEKSIAEKDLDDIIRVSVERLRNMQKENGGWDWWSSDDSDYFVTAYVTEYLVRAKNIGANVDNDMLDKAKKYFKNDPSGNYSEEEKYIIDILRSYGLSLFGEKKVIENFRDNTPDDILAMAVMANVRNGFYDAAKNGRDRLISAIKEEGNEMLFWSKGSSQRFGSEDASSGMALRAYLMAGGSKDTASKVVRFLTEKRKKNYWSNTFATAQVIQSLTDFSKIEKTLFPVYSYEVKLNGETIFSGKFNEKNTEDKFSIPVEKIKPDSILTVSKNGGGQLYSEILIKEFNLDSNAKPANKGINVSRSYVNEKGKDYSIGVGDVVDVNLSINGDFSNSNFLVIEDQLPAGLTPVNPKFKNSQYGNKDKNYDYEISAKEITENGIIVSARNVNPQGKIYSYKARVVSEGSFLAPPAVAFLMYSPEVYGHSGVQEIKTVKKSENQSEVKNIMEDKFKKSSYYKYSLAVSLAMFLIAVGFIIYKVKAR